MRAISLWQPWASLCCIPHPNDPKRSVKGYETRSWSTSYRGPLLIHAALRFTRGEICFCKHVATINESLKRAGYKTLDDIPRGAIIGQVELIGCHPAMAVYPEIDRYAMDMGHYDHGRFAWEIVNPIMFEEPIPWKGQQGFFDVNLKTPTP